MFLSRDELQTLTGRRQRRAVIAELKRRRYVYELDANGWPLVLADAVRARFVAPANTWTSPARRGPPEAPLRRPADQGL